MKLRDFFLGKSASRPGKEVIASGGGFGKSKAIQGINFGKNLIGT